MALRQSLRASIRAISAASVSGPQATGLRHLSARAQHEPLHDSMSDANYESRPASGASGLEAERPLARDPAVRRAKREMLNSLSEAEPEFLGNSMSGAEYPLPRITSSRFSTLSSVCDPDYLLGNSMSQGDYAMPKSLRSPGLRPSRQGQGFGVGRGGRPGTMQRIVVASRAVDTSREPLHDSFSAVDYSEQRNASRK